MAKFVFSAPPKTFKHVVKFKTLDGANAEIGVTFVYRNRKAFGELFDDMLKAAKSKGLQDRAKDDLSMAEVMDATVGDNGQYLLKALDSWELEEELNLTNAERLCNDYPAAANAIMEAYRIACTEGRLGN